MVMCSVPCLQGQVLSVLHLCPVRTVLGTTVWHLCQGNDPVISQNMFRNSNTSSCIMLFLWESLEDPVFLLTHHLGKN